MKEAPNEITKNAIQTEIYTMWKSLWNLENKIKRSSIVQIIVLLNYDLKIGGEKIFEEIITKNSFQPDDSRPMNPMLGKWIYTYTSHSNTKNYQR